MKAPAWLAALLLTAPVAAVAQQQQPRVERPAQPPQRGSGPTGNDTVESPVPPRPQGGVLRPPGNVDPGIQVPTPRPGATTPVIPPPGAPGGDRNVQPR